MGRLQGRIAVVTGGGAGIGEQTALQLAARGASIAVCDLNLAAAESVAEAIRHKGSSASAHAVDVTSEDAMRALPAEVIECHGAVDIVVNNAGVASEPTLTPDLRFADFRAVMAVNFWGVVHGSMFFLPHLLQRSEASLVNVSSNAGLMAYGRMAAYSSSKFAVRGFTESLRMELAGGPVAVTLVHPGSTKTRIIANSPVIDEGRRASVQAKVDATWGRPPEAVAAAIVHGIERRRSRVLIGPDTRAMDLVVRLIPGAYSRMFSSPVLKVLQGLEADRPSGLPEDHRDTTARGGSSEGPDESPSR